MNTGQRKRFWEKVDIKSLNECWNWEASCANGYGAFALYTGKRVQSHRVAYTEWFGSIPEGDHICHKCDNKKCCNPLHLFTGNNSANHQDAAGKRRTGNKGLYKSQVEQVDWLLVNGYNLRQTAEIMNTSISTTWRMNHRLGFYKRFPKGEDLWKTTS